MPNQAPAHWSKDFVEHLRTVHFALIAVSAGLVLLVVSSKQYNAVTALVQMEEILDLKKQWSLKWVLERGRLATTFRPERISEDYANPYNSSSPKLPMPSMTDVMITDRSILGTVSLGKRLVFVECKFPEPNWYRERRDDGEWSEDSFPRTLYEFRHWWETLDNSHPMYVPLSFSNLWLAQSGKLLFVRLLDIDTSKRKRETIDLQLSNLGVPEDLSSASPDAPTYSEYVAMVQLPNGKTEAVAIPIVEFSMYKISQRTVSELFRTLNLGSFSQSFADLSVATKGEEYLPLEDIKEFLHDEAAKGPEVFEALGMKFPAGQITFWGVVLLLSVQLYFLVYLRQLVGKLKTEDPGWDVPWIGMDSSQLSKTILYVSLVLLPCIAAILLVWQATIRLSSGYWERAEHWYHPVRFFAGPWHWHYTVLLKILFLILAAIASGYLGLLCWKYRPQIAPERPKPPSCLPLLFE